MRSSSERETSPSSSAAHPPRSEPAGSRFAESLWGGPATALAAILAGAATLRAVGLEYGLPFGNLLNPDEQSIVPRAWKMVHGGGADPHWFDYPTLLMYVQAPFQWWQPEPSFLTARIVAVALGAGAVAATWWLGRAAFGTPLAGAVAAAVVAVEATHVAYSHASVTDVPLTLGIAVALALMVSGRIELAGAAAGLATGFKYPGVLLVAPLLVAGWGQWRRLAVAGALMAAVFLASSPFVLVHPGQALHDAWRVQRLAHDGWLGFEHDHAAPVAFVERLWDGMGPALLVAAGGLILALVRRGRADRVLAAFVLVYFVDLLTIGAHFDRYVLPLVPALAALAARFRSLAPVTLLLLVIPLTWTVRNDRDLTRTDTRVVAADWIAAHVPRGTRVAADPSTPFVAGLDVLPLQLPGPGRSFDPNRSLARLHARRVRAVIVSGAVTDRVLAARERYPRETAFYEALARRPRAYYLAPGGRLAGPWVAVYRLP